MHLQEHPAFFFSFYLPSFYVFIILILTNLGRSFSNRGGHLQTWNAAAQVRRPQVLFKILYYHFQSKSSKTNQPTNPPSPGDSLHPVQHNVTKKCDINFKKMESISVAEQKRNPEHRSSKLAESRAEINTRSWLNYIYWCPAVPRYTVCCFVSLSRYRCVTQGYALPCVAFRACSSCCQFLQLVCWFHNATSVVPLKCAPSLQCRIYSNLCRMFIWMIIIHRCVWSHRVR